MAPTFGNITSIGGGYWPGVAFAHDNGSATLLLLAIDWQYTNTDAGPDGVEYGGVAMTKLNGRPDLWYLVNPPSGSNNFVFDHINDILSLANHAISVNGADLTSPFGTVVTATGTGTTPTVTATGSSTSIMLGLIGHRINNGDGEVISSVTGTLLGSVNTGGTGTLHGFHLAQSKAATGSGVVLDGTISESTPWRALGVAINEVSSGGPPAAVVKNYRKTHLLMRD